MRTALCKVVDETGIILPRTLLKRLGLTAGAVIDVTVDGGRLILTPIGTRIREGWAEGAAAVAEFPDPEAEEWLNVPNEADADLRW